MTAPAVFLPTIKNYTQAEFAAFVKTLSWTGWSSKGWRPQFITLHNTALPTLADFLNKTLGDRQKRIENILDIYKNQYHWHSGPHLFIDPYQDGIWNTCDLLADGVSVSCWNDRCIGIEMLGNYATDLEQHQTKDPPPVDPWSCPEAGVVRDNAVYAMAVLHNALGIRPDGYVEGERGLHFHRECTRDAHACPGGQVVKADIVNDVLAKMAELSEVA